MLVGFLFTAIPNWIGRPPPTGAPPAGLAGIWLAGRVSLLMDGLPWQAVAAIDIAFLPLAVVMLPPLVTTRNRRNIAFPIALMALGAANLLFHLVAAGMPVPAAEATRGVLGIMMVILVVIGGRVIPFFTANRLPEVAIRRNAGLDRCATVAVVATAILSVVAPFTLVGGVAVLAAATLLPYRGWRWMPWSTRKLPMLWLLHAGYAWIVVALLLGA